MDFDAKYKENFSSHHLPLFFHENYSKQRDEFAIEEALSSKGNTSFIQDVHPLENFSINASSSTSNHGLFSIQPNCFDSFENSPYGFLPSFDLFETKLFGNHAMNNGSLAPFMDNMNQNIVGGGGVGILGHSQMITTPINMLNNSSTQSYNPFSYYELGPPKYRPSDEDSCTTPKAHGTAISSGLSTTTMVRRGRKKKPNVVKGQWTIEEDRLLIQLVERYGVRKWSQIAQMLNGRIGKQCRERWHNHLRPDIKKDLWNEEEDRILIKAHAEIGNKWAEIAKKLPGRTENSIKNHWNATKRRQYSKRKCRSKYPRQSSLLQEYIKSLTPETINAGCRKKQPSSGNHPNSLENTTKSSNDQSGYSNSGSSDRIGPEYDFSEVPDFNFDAQMFEESSIDSLLDYAPNNDEKCNAFGYDHQLVQGSSQIMNDSEIVFSPIMQSEVKRELDLVEMINQVNL